MKDQLKGELMERIQRLERSIWIWRIVSIFAFAGILVIAGYAYSQRDPQKVPPIQPQEKAQPNQQFIVDPTPPPVTYTNFARVNVTPEELILDLGLNAEMVPDGKTPVKITNRVVMNYYTAKRLNLAIASVVQAHEATYGALELDFQKRMKKPN